MIRYILRGTEQVMPHIPLLDGVPGILGPMLVGRYRAMNRLTEETVVLGRYVSGYQFPFGSKNWACAAALRQADSKVWLFQDETWAPQDQDLYRQQAARLSTEAYVGSTETLTTAETV